MAIGGVLFDTGDTLIRPIGGRWNPRFDFEAVLLAHVPDAPTDRCGEAFAVGQRFLDDTDSTPSRADYHRVILECFGIEPTDALLEDLDRPLAVPPVEPFPDVLAVLDELQSLGLRMAVVTDNWGTAESVRRLHDQLGLGHYFAHFSVSADLGVNKPDPRMYRDASDALGLRPDECVFVDDDPALVEAAVALGYAGAAICRSGRPESASVATITTLGQVLELL